MEYNIFQSELARLLKTDCFENCNENIIDDRCGFIHEKPFINFIKIKNGNSVVSAINRYIETKHFITKNLDINALKCIDKWYDIRQKIWNWQYDTTFFFTPKDENVSELRNIFSKQLLKDEKITVIIHDRLPNSSDYPRPFSDKLVRCFTDLYGEIYDLYLSSSPSSLDGDALCYTLILRDKLIIKGKWLWHN